MSSWTAPRPSAVVRFKEPARRATPQRTEPVHLTKRGRFLIVLGLVALLTAAFWAGRSLSDTSAATAATPKAPLPQVTVQQGDTLWSLARDLAPENDPREVVAQIRSLNHLETANVLVGQQIVLPRAA